MVAVCALAVAGLGFGAAESRVSGKAMAAVEDLFNDKFRAPGADAYDLLGTARCTYLDGYGALITVEMQLVYVTAPNPFRPAYTPAEIVALRERQLKKLPVLKETMRGLLASSAVTLDSMPLNQKVAIEARLWHYRWEEPKGVPGRVFMSAEKSKLLAAHGDAAALAAVIEEREQ